MEEEVRACWSRGMGGCLFLSAGVSPPLQSMEPLDFVLFGASWGLCSSPPWGRHQRGDVELEKVLETQPNEERKKELHTVSKSTRINYSKGPAVPYIQ